MLLAVLFATGSILSQASTITSLQTTPPTDQGNTLQCWAVSSIARLDIAASAQAGHLLKLSPKYTVYTKTRDEVIRLILARDFHPYQGILCEDCEAETIYYEQGGIYADAVEAARNDGIMPDQVYGGFPDKDERLFRRLNELIARYAKRAGTPQRAQVERDVTAVLDHFLGRPPASFEYDGKSYTPKSFFAAYLPGWDQAGGVELNYDPRNSFDGETTATAYDDRPFRAFATRDQGRVLAVISETLKAGETALVQYRVIDEDHTQRLGHIGFAINNLAPQTPQTIAWDDPSILDHYVLAIGAQWSSAGELEKILVKNTWGLSPTENGGYHWIEPDYFPWLESVEINPDILPSL